MKKLFFNLFICLTLTSTALFAQQHFPKKPKLVVGIVVDQMRYDYLTRFDKKYQADGFKRLLTEGFSLENAHYNHIPTYTAVGHASIFTGASPSIHGIIGNNWYDKYEKKSIYCVDDDAYKTVGNHGDEGERSPRRLRTTTFADQLRLSQSMNGKTIGIAIKDRSAILPAGHTANAAYWFDGDEQGKWISSSYYMDNLPSWVVDFNNSNKAKSYLNKAWTSLYNINTYTESIEDDNLFEASFRGEEKPVFPHNISELAKSNGNYNLLKLIPAGNSFTTDFAKAAIIGENLGGTQHTDFLSISYSSTDYVGHQFGVSSKEIEDTYLRLDKDLANLFSFLDTKVGKNNYTVFLTADHAATEVPQYLQSVKIPAAYFKPKEFLEYLQELTLRLFGSDELIENISNFQIFLDHNKISNLKINYDKLTQSLVDYAVKYKDIYKAVSAKTLQATYFTEGILCYLQNGYNQKYSGDVLLIPNPSTVIYPKVGSTHGSGYSYDTHIPIIFYGKGIKKGSSKKKYHIVDIAPTLSNLLNIAFPNGNSGKIVEEALK
ncbi:MAG: alkaline phosphatase PafA [Tenacibaculum sp.]